MKVKKGEPVTSGSVNVYRVHFDFSPDWEGMMKTACFRSGSQTVSVLLDGTGECTIPWEVTDPDDKGKTLYAGVCGTQDGEVMLPTIWASLGVILEGVTACGSASRPPTPGLYDQVLSVLRGKQDKLTGKPGQIAGFDEKGDLTAQDPPSDGGTDHRHTIDAITGLEDALQQIPVPMTAAELQNILNGGNRNA